MYASERSSELEHINIGGEAQGDSKNLFFFAGDIYVKMWTNSDDDVQEVLREIGKTLAERIDPDAGYPTVVTYFPVENKKPYSEAYITSSYIGHEFLKSVYTADYMIENKDFQVFIVDGKNTDGARNILENYVTFTKQPLVISEGELLLNDRYNGEIPVIWKGRYIIGIYNNNGQTPGPASAILKDIRDRLE